MGRIGEVKDSIVRLKSDSELKNLPVRIPSFPLIPLPYYTRRFLKDNNLSKLPWYYLSKMDYMYDISYTWTSSYWWLYYPRYLRYLFFRLLLILNIYEVEKGTILWYGNFKWPWIRRRNAKR